MATELKGRFATYNTGNSQTKTVEKQSRWSLNAVKTDWGIAIARKVLEDKVLVISEKAWFELELLPGEKNAEETAKEKKKIELCRALYLDLRQSYPSLTLANVVANVEKLMAGDAPTGIIQMFAHPYLIQLGLVKGVV